MNVGDKIGFIAGEGEEEAEKKEEEKESAEEKEEKESEEAEAKEKEPKKELEKKEEKPKAEKKTPGTIQAEDIRARCNKLTEAEPRRLRDEAMRLFYECEPKPAGAGRAA